MKNNKIIATSIASMMLIAGMAMPKISAAGSAEIRYAKNSGYLTSDNSAIVVGLTNGDKDLTEDELKQLVKEKYGLTVTEVIGTVGTGAKIKLSNGATATLVVYGDATGDGKITLLDAQAAFDHYRKTTTLTDAAFRAGDLVEEAIGEDVIGLIDAQRIFDIYRGDRTSLVVDTEKLPEDEGIIDLLGFEVKYTSSTAGTITVTLNEDVKEPRFYVNGKLVSAQSKGNGVYEISATNLKENKENTLKVTDETDTFNETRTFTYRQVKAITDITVAATSSNKEGEVNASNVSNATLLARIADTTLNKMPVTLEITVTGKDADGKAKDMTFTQPLTGFETEVRLNRDLTSFADGTLTVTTVVKDDQGNVSATVSGSINKKSNAPIVRYIDVDRSSATAATIEVLKQGDVSKVYYVVKEVGDSAPTVEDVLKTTKPVLSPASSSTLSINMDGCVANKAYVVYLVAQTATGTNSVSVEAVSVAKVGAKQIAEVTTLRQETGKDATFVWEYNEEEKGLVGYKVILLKGSTTIAEKTVNKGEAKEVDFFNELKASTKGDGAYTVKMIALADNVDYTNSDESATVIVNLPKVVNSITPTLKDTVLSWVVDGDVANVESYTVKVEKYNSKSQENDKYELVATQDTTVLTYDIKSIVEQNGKGTYRFTVVANPKANALAATVSGTAVDKYHLGVAVQDLTFSKLNNNKKIEFTATLLPENLYDNVTPSYTLYCRVADGEYDSSNRNMKISVTESPFTFSGTSDGLVDGKTYCFTLVTTVDGKEYKSNEVEVNLPLTAISTDSRLTYIKYEENEGSTIVDNPTIKISDGQITYKDGVLYVKETSKDLVKYDSKDYPVVTDIISVLDQMTPVDVDEISSSVGDEIRIVKNEITAFVVKAPESAKVYDLSKVAKSAFVRITGNDKAVTTVNGELEDITLKGTAAKFDLSGLTVTNGVSVSDDNYELKVANNTKVTLDSQKSIVTVNDVKLTKAAAEVIVRGDVFEFTGDSVALKVDSTKANREVTLDFKSVAENTLEITANNNYATKVTTNTIKGGTLTVKSGKVDLSDANTSFTAVEVLDAVVTLVLDVPATETLNDTVIKTTKGTLIEGSSFEFVASAESIDPNKATYSTVEGSREVTLRASGTNKITVTKK